MKQFWKEVCISLLLTVFLPAVLMNAGLMLSSTSSKEETVPAMLPTVTTETDEDTLWVRVLQEDGTVADMELETYLVGVVLGEMPADFEPEALKAQAVVARTYTLRNHILGSKHSDADVCMESDCCQGYRILDSGWELEKIRSAVEDTAGLVLTYGGKLIEATYFASSGGRTEDAVAVWGNDVPYLRSTPSPEGPFAQYHLETKTLDLADFILLLGLSHMDPGQVQPENVTHTAGGGVDTVTICGKIFRGTELRQLLGLRSTLFQMAVVGDRVIVTTQGYGHRVGMSQYGAEAMALEGAGFREILEHYYQGTVVEEFVDKDSSIG